MSHMPQTMEQAERLYKWILTVERLKQLTNGELADLLTEHLWAGMPLGSPQSDLLAESIARLKEER